MRTIEVDFDVFKALTMRRPSENVTENDVLRKLLGLEGKGQFVKKNDATAVNKDDWFTKGVRFPVGTEFRANYKGQTYLGRVEGRALVINGKKFDTPSAAAVSITRNAVNGWKFWECRLPGAASWQPITVFRKQ
ncbi:MAG TPA: hypothetical protein VLV32_09155 [Burkholderiales bacterium]|nr:hypothetical protein [Burkholderiales bacterium]